MNNVLQSLKERAACGVVDIVLVGGGHSHVGVLRSFGERPLAAARLTLVSSDRLTPYSGVLPGYVAGHYSYEEMHIDLLRLAEFARARFVCDRVVALDREQQQVICSSGQRLHYDCLSINVGATPSTEDVAGAREYATPIKPVSVFNERWLALLERIRGLSGRHPPLVVAVVGGGAGGIELTLAIAHRLRCELRALGRDDRGQRVHLFAAGSSILPTHHARVRRKCERVLAERGVIVHCNSEVVAVRAREICTRRGERLAVDEIFWVTRAAAAAWLRETGLLLDAAGFVRVRETLQTVNDPLIFAAGDCAALPCGWVEKAGVFAVRQGKPLAENLRRRVTGGALLHYRPARRWLALIATGDRRAIASRGGFAAEGRWVWYWKDWIDRRFLRRFQVLPPS